MHLAYGLHVQDAQRARRVSIRHSLGSDHSISPAAT